MDLSSNLASPVNKVTTQVNNLTNWIVPPASKLTNQIRKPISKLEEELLTQNTASQGIQTMNPKETNAD